MTETQQRFLRAIAERVPMEHVVELHLFPPIRQGGVETGVAVVAEDPRRPLPNVEAAGVPESVLDAAAETGDAERPEAESSDRDRPDNEPIAAAETASDDESPYADEAVVEVSAELDGESDDDESDHDSSNGIAPAAPRPRYTIHTASYRLTLKGVDRGKWEVDVVAEADAPLDAVDAVVRGVQRRAGEGAEPDRLNAEAFRGALEAPLATLER